MAKHCLESAVTEQRPCECPFPAFFEQSQCIALIYPGVGLLQRTIKGQEPVHV